MFALSQLREVMTTSRDLIKDYDSDAVSLTSTVEDDDDPYYNANCIVAEDLEAGNSYLISWEGYPLDQCTWEPPSHLDGTDLLSRWEQLKQELGIAAFQRENEKNIEAYEAAQEKAEAVNARKHAKREQKRRRKQQRKRAVIPDDDGSDQDPLPLAQLRDSLFVGDQTSAAPASPVIEPSRIEQPQVARRPPVQQSSSEEDSASDAEGLVRTRSAQCSKAQSATDRSKSSPGLGKKRIEIAASATTLNAPVAHKSSEQESRVSPASTAVEIRSTTTKSIPPKSADRDSATLNTVRAKRTAPQKQASRAISFVHQPVEKRKRECVTERPYSKVAHRWRAEKKSRTEGAPDFDALTFVNGPISTPSKPAPPPPSNDDVYGRRETAHRPIQGDGQDSRTHRGLENDSTPLAAWEADKVPLVCFHWVSSTCPRSPQDCRFMHRRFDPEGRPYATGDYDGYVPHKYRKPPFTCPYWYKGRKCRKTAEECSYAHQDTGWAEVNGVPQEINQLPPEYLAPIAPHTFVPPKLQDPPITCSFWLREPRGCFRSEAGCKYAHWNTGWAHPESDVKGQPIRIDPSMGPRGGPPKHANPPVTCPFWLRSDTGCEKTDNDCKYAHWNTGWAPPKASPLGAAQPINPHELPRSQSTRDTPGIALRPSNGKPQTKKDITCSFWLRDPQGCSNSEEACSYAHKNTGWAAPSGKMVGAPVALDPNQIPRSHRNQLGKKLEPKYGQPPVTCPSWLRSEDGCLKTDEACRYAHRNTGWTLQYGEGGGPIVKISQSEKPRFNRDYEIPGSDVPPENDPSRITCYFWLKGQRGCVKTAAECRFAHRNTGWLVHLGGSNDSKPRRISLRMLPLFRRSDSIETQDIQSVEPLSRRATDEPLANGTVLTQTSTVTGTVHVPKQQHAQSESAIQDGLHKVAAAVTTVSYIKSMVEKLWNLDFVQMFMSGVPGDGAMLERQAMLLYDPKEHPEETELITRWLLIHNVKVANLWYDGAWSQFREDVAEHKSGVIIVHPDFEHYVDLPGLGDVLKQKVRMWSVGLQQPSWFRCGVDASPSELRHNCVNIFPHGGLIYITDDVFEQKPQLALGIIKLFFSNIEKLRSLDGPGSPWLEVDDACLLWRLCVRPELMEYLYLKCRDKSAELVAGNPDHISRFDLYHLLTSTNYIEQDNTEEPPSSVLDKYPIRSERREVAEHPSLDYFNHLENSQEGANTQMIGFYAAMQSADLRRTYRSFYVVHTEPKAACAQQWKASIHTVTDVISPEKCFEELSKPSKESLFDFLDWAMEPKEEKIDAVAEEDELGDMPMDISPTKGIQEIAHTAY